MKLNKNNSFEKGLFCPAFSSNQHSGTQIDAWKKEMDSYPHDVEYRKDLLRNLGQDPNEYYRLRSIIGGQEISEMMRSLDAFEDAYSVGASNENLLKGGLRANPHLHTVASDGMLPISTMLEKATEYADRVVASNPSAREAKLWPYVTGLTDHDTTDGCQEAIRMIFDQPQKYKNLKLMLGTEHTSYNFIAPELFKRALNSHILTYGIDPNEATYAAFINGNKQKKEEILSRMVACANDVYKKTCIREGELFSKNEALGFYDILNKRILGIFNYAMAYIKTKFILEEAVLKNPHLRQKLFDRGLPIDANSLLNELKKYNITNFSLNKASSSIVNISRFLAGMLGENAEIIKELIIKELSQPQSSSFLDEFTNLAEGFKANPASSARYLPTFEDISKAINPNKSSIAGIAHPLLDLKELQTVDAIKAALSDMYSKFKNAFGNRAVFSEAYYQSYKESVQRLKETRDIKTFISELSERFKLYRTGSADSHGLNIFKRF